MTNSIVSDTSRLAVAPGQIVVVRDATWLVTKVEETTSGTLVHSIGLSELVRDTTASFYSDLDRIEALDPAQAKVVADSSSQYRHARLWLEATLRRQSVAVADPRLTVSTRMLADPLGYQLKAVERALDPERLRPRLLIADAVGLGKTIEIGMILSELVRRGQGERILVVTPRHVLEQMQRELWTRFALPFVRLDSLGIQRVRQELPATRNPFSYYKRVIISIDTLKQDQYRAHLEQHRWDAVVIDESHNVTGSSTLNNRLARTLAPNTNALILASATPHNGKPESFAELIRLLEPSAVRPDGSLDRDAVQRLVLRRHRHSPEVAAEVGDMWAERLEPRNVLVTANPAEQALAEELDRVWLHPVSGKTPYSGKNSSLFPWTLAKAFLSSPVALRESIANRQSVLRKNVAFETEGERQALARLDDLALAVLDEGSAKFTQLVDELRRIGINRAKKSTERVVVFSERVATLGWLRSELKRVFKFSDDEIKVLHGQLTDVEQQEIVEEFKQASSPLRVLITGDVASEGVNLHSQCHELIHYDIPWSLIRIEQRNGRIDRYGQRVRPQVTTLLLDLADSGFAGDVRVLTRLVEREHEAHLVLGDSASLMGKYDAAAEERAITDVLRGARELDDVVSPVADVMDDPLSLESLLAGWNEPEPETSKATQAETIPPTGLFATPADFFTSTIEESYTAPRQQPGHGGIGLTPEPAEHTLVITPPVDLKRRLEVLPQSYLAERKITEQFRITTSPDVANRSLKEAQDSRTSISLWPTEHYLGPLHPVLDWAADKTLAKLGRNEVFAVRGSVHFPTVLLSATLTDRQARTVSLLQAAQTVTDSDQRNMLTRLYPDAASMLREAGITGDAKLTNPGAAEVAGLQPLIAAAVHETESFMRNQVVSVTKMIEQRVADWQRRLASWQESADDRAQIPQLRERRAEIASENELAESMLPQHLSVRPLLVVLPADWPIEGNNHRGE